MAKQRSPRPEATRSPAAGGALASARLLAAINQQVGNEMHASLQYVAIASHFAAENLPRLAAFFYRQADEERAHAMKFVHFVVDVGGRLAIPPIGAPRAEFASAAQAVALALDWERTVTEQIYRLVDVAREDRNYIAQRFLDWFVTEQLEEIKTMSTLLSLSSARREEPALRRGLPRREPDRRRAGRCCGDLTRGRPAVLGSPTAAQHAFGEAQHVLRSEHQLVERRPEPDTVRRGAQLAEHDAFLAGSRHRTELGGALGEAQARMPREQLTHLRDGEGRWKRSSRLSATAWKTPPRTAWTETRGGWPSRLASCASASSPAARSAAG